MVRDMDYIRNLLLEIEAAPAHEPWTAQTSEETPDWAEMSEHLRLLHRAGFIHVDYHQVYLGGGEVWMGVKLEWQGHEFLNNVRDATVWAKTKERIASVAGTVSLSVASQLAGQVAKQIFNLS